MFLKLFISFFIIGCMQNIVNSAPNLTVGPSVNGKTYYVGLDRVNFIQAVIDCQQSGMSLANVMTIAEEEALDELLLHVPKNGSWADGFWLSGTNLANTGTTRYYWLSGGEKIIFSNWLPNEPSNPETEYCISWVEINNEVGWNDYTCTEEMRYVCEKDTC